MMKDGCSYELKIENVKIEDDHTYIFFIGDGKADPELTDEAGEYLYEETNGTLKSGNIDKYLQLAPEQYLYVYDRTITENRQYEYKLLINKIKLEKPEQYKYADVFERPIVLTEDWTRIKIRTPWDSDTIRKMHIRIGKINNDTILNDIYEKKNNAFENLQNYSKTAEAIYDNTLDSDEDTGLNMEQGILSYNKLNHNEYYFLYVLLEDEDGKFVKTEGVTLARSNVFDDEYYFLFYGVEGFNEEDFKTDELSESLEETSDYSTENTQNTWTKIAVIILIIALITAVIILLIACVMIYNKNKKTKKE